MECKTTHLSSAKNFLKLILSVSRIPSAKPGKNNICNAVSYLIEHVKNLEQAQNLVRTVFNTYGVFLKAFSTASVINFSIVYRVLVGFPKRVITN